MLDRGYTGHAYAPQCQWRREHLEGAHIINMPVRRSESEGGNGREPVPKSEASSGYDPDLGLFLSPDPILQNPYSTQPACRNASTGRNYNRYSYVVPVPLSEATSGNNPLKYTDPTGYRMSFQELSYFENQRVQSGGGDYRGYMFGANIDVPDSDGFIMWNSWIDSGVSGLVNFTDYQSGIENGVSFKSYDSGDKDYVVAKYSALANNGLQGEWIPLMSTDPLEKGYTFLLNGVAANSGGGKSEPWLTVNFNRGIPQIETNFTDKDWGAITPGPFIVYPKGGSEDTYYNKHEPGHVIQFLILGPVAYYGLIAIPSLISSTTPYHSDMPWEKSANQLWYWLTGENDPRNPLYFDPNKK
ncbi:MAG: hypothetical protein AB7S69_04520 [Salinivirgaceae bacterium]